MGRLARAACSCALLGFCMVIWGCKTPTSKPYTDVKAGTKAELKSKWAEPQNGRFVVSKDWWTAMGDAKLNELLETAIADNIDLSLLVTRMRQAQVELAGAKAAQWPTLGATAQYSGTRTEGTSTSVSTAGVTLGWEADIWGRLKDLKKAQFLEFKATESDWRAGYLALVSSVSRSYFAIRQLDEQEQLHSKSLATTRKTLKLFEDQEKAGIATADMLSKQKAEIHRLEGQVKEIQRRRQVLLNELAILLGKTPGSVKLEPAALRSSVKLIELPKEIQADLLTRRPDLVAAELRVKSAYRQQESSRAARWPRVTIGMGGGISADTLSTGWVGMIVPKIEFPALDPQTKVRLQLSEVALEAAQKQYKKTALQAIREAADATVNLQRHSEQYESEKKRLAELQKAAKTISARITAGMATPAELHAAQLSTLATEQRVLELYAQLLVDQTLIHSALGGGW